MTRFLCEESGPVFYRHVVVDVGTTHCEKAEFCFALLPSWERRELFTLELAPKHGLLWALSLERKIQIEVSGKEHHLCSYIWKEKNHPQ